MSNERELIRELLSIVQDFATAGAARPYIDKQIAKAAAYLATPEVDAVTAEMVRLAMHLCPSDLSYPEKWRWMSRHISKAITKPKDSP